MPENMFYFLFFLICSQHCFSWRGSFYFFGSHIYYEIGTSWINIDTTFAWLEGEFHIWQSWFHLSSFWFLWCIFRTKLHVTIAINHGIKKSHVPNWLVNFVCWSSKVRITDARRSLFSLISRRTWPLARAVHEINNSRNKLLLQFCYGDILFCCRVMRYFYPYSLGLLH